MANELTVITARVDDVPILVSDMNRMGIAALLDEHFRVHGNWQGISLGRLTTGWLSHILSEGDHRLNQVERWAEQRPETLRGCLGQDVTARDFTDDRLAIVLDTLSNDERWIAFEAALNRRTLRVYDLTARCVRLDSTTASGYWTTTEDGLFQFGHSKDRRPDLPQVKVMLSTLDPLGLPVVSQVVSGEKADDRLYLPAIQQVRTGLQASGLLYVGNCKMLALQTRADLQAGGDFYLGPLSKVQLPDEILTAYLTPVWSGEQALAAVSRPAANGQVELIAEGYERSETLTAAMDDQTLTWVERRLVIRSVQQAKAATATLHARLTQAQTALAALNERGKGKQRFTAVAPLQQAAEVILRHHHVEGLLSLRYHEAGQQRPVRRYGNRPAETRVDRTVTIQVSRDEEAIRQAVREPGWRVYATNQPAEQLSLDQAVLAYREEYLIERGFGRLKGKALSLTPMDLQDDDRATGLIRLLTLGPRVLTLLEGRVRQRLAEQHEKLAGLYAGNPKRATARPTSEALLQAFKPIDLTLVRIGQHIHRHVTSLSELQQRILALLDLATTIYSTLAADSSDPP